METNKRGIAIAVMVAMVLAAVETTVVTIAVPTIVKQLKGFQLISWVFSLYLLTSSVTTPVYGKLADLYGRKNTLSIGIVIFLIGSFLCGLSQNMHELIFFRAVQGIGAGSIYTITYTILGDVFPISERAKVQGWLSSAWGISSLVGPLVGGAVIDTLSWHWIFFINIPFGIISIVFLQKNLKENFKRRKVDIDYPGIIFLTAAISVLLLSFMSNGNSYNVKYYKFIAGVLGTAVLLIIFYISEKRASDPIMPLKIFNRSNVLVNVISFISSAVLIGIDVYMSIYMQNVLGYSAAVSGIAVAPMSVTWFLSSFVLGDKIIRYGEKIIIIMGSLCILAGNLCLVTLGTSSSPVLVSIFTAILGLGFGISFTTLTVVVQSSVEYNMRGAATAANTLVRNLGQTIGVSIFGIVFNISITAYLAEGGIRNINPNKLYSSYNTALGIADHIVRNSLNYGIHIIFVCMIILDLVVFILSLFVSNRIGRINLKR